MRPVLAGLSGVLLLAIFCSAAPRSAAVAHCEAGKRALAEREFRIAMAEADAAIALDPSLADAHALRAAILAERTQYREALVEYLEAVRLNSRDGPSWYQIGVLRHATGDPRGALKAYDRAIALAPSASAFNDRGLTRYELQDVAGARRDFEDALALDPAFTSANVNLARLDIEAAAFDAAIERLTRVLERDPDANEALELRSNAYEATGRSAEAAQDREAIRRLRSRGARYPH